VTRIHNKKSVGLTILTAMILAAAIGFSDMTGENQADTLVYEFGELLDGVEAEILSIPNDTNPSADTTDTMRTENILSQIAYIEAFDEVIRKQIL